MPSKAQANSVAPSGGGSTYVSQFLPVLGGNYEGIRLANEASHGLWWTSESYSNANRYYLAYTENALYVYARGYRNRGYYIRCVAKQKTITDLAYMQDVTFFLDFSEW